MNPAAMLIKQRYEEEILRKVQALPERELPKVISLLDRLEEEEKKKKAEEYRRVIKELKGKYRDVMSSSEEFSGRKQDEKELDL